MGSPGRSAWTAGQVARHLGIAESTLRSWHRRYGIGPQGSRPGRYRRYSEEDVARLRRMLDLIGLGLLASEAARTVQAGELEPVPAERDVADLIAAANAFPADWVPHSEIEATVTDIPPKRREHLLAAIGTLETEAAIAAASS